jgi:flagellar hook-basal body complex protein FliE
VIVPVGGLSSLSLGSTEAATHAQSSGGVGAGGEAGGFGGELTEAISSLEKSQDSATSASQALAMGTVSDPETAIVTVEDAQMAMELASQIRTKATEAATDIFNTQV